MIHLGGQVSQISLSLRFWFRNGWCRDRSGSAVHAALSFGTFQFFILRILFFQVQSVYWIWLLRFGFFDILVRVVRVVGVRGIWTLLHWGGVLA